MSKTIQEVIKIADKNGLKLKEDTLIFNESGLDFQVVFALDNEGDKWVLRFPRREDVMIKTKLEKKVLELVNQYVSFQAPNWLIYTDELIAYRKLNGAPVGTIDHETKSYIWEIDIKNVPECFHETLGRILAELHSIPKKKAEEAGLVIHTAEEARTSMKERMDAVRSNFGVGESLWSRWEAWMNDEEMWPKETGFIHGDVHAGHILIDKSINVTGLIDWTEAKVTDISNDFVIYYNTFGEAGLDSLIKAYKEAGGYYWPKMKEHIIQLVSAYPIAIAEFAIESGIEEYVQMAKEALEVETK